jgi:hypothetical protein
MKYSTMHIQLETSIKGEIGGTLRIAMKFSLMDLNEGYAS